MIRSFVLELVVIEVLKSSGSKNNFEMCLTTLWEKLRDDMDSIIVEDPANPSGNDLSEQLRSVEHSAAHRAVRLGSCLW
jgi:histidinol-phosphate/aromatic aminotransferase/cobyric acid decarboxylase-like protein